MKTMYRQFTFAAGCAVLLLLTGCANMTIGTPAGSVENTAKLRAGALAPANVGAFTPAAGKVASMDHGTTIRGNPIGSPVQNSFTQYLRETVKAELNSAGLFDANANTVITGTLTDSELDAAIGTGKGKLAARFVVTRDGAVRYDRELNVHATWESSFMGAVAIPAAGREYEALYRKLVTALLDDASFRAAIAKNQ